MRSIAVLAFFFSAQAFACPDLTGAFTCKYQDGTSEQVTISQDNKSGVFVYNYNGSQVVADNNSYDVPDDDSLKGGKFKAWCEDDVTLKANLTGKYWQNNAPLGDLDMNLFFSLENNNLKTVNSGNLKTATETYPIDQTTVCTRN